MNTKLFKFAAVLVGLVCAGLGVKGLLTKKEKTTPQTSPPAGAEVTE